MALSPASGDATKNRVTLRLQLLGSAASNGKLAELLPLLNSAVYSAFGVGKDGAAASAGLVAAVAADAVGAADAKQIQQGILAAAARRAMQYYMKSSPAKLGRMRYILQHGVPVGVQTIGALHEPSYELHQRMSSMSPTMMLRADLLSNVAEGFRWQLVGWYACCIVRSQVVATAFCTRHT
jgi:hypothetical protein